MRKDHVRKKAILFLGGSLSEKSSLTKKSFAEVNGEVFFIVAADHGADLALQYGFIPDLVIGDNDSLSSATHLELTKKSIPFITFSADKDATDSELALQYLIDQEYQDIICFGFEGSRSDHFLSNVALFSTFVKKDVHIKAIGQECYYYFFSDSLKIFAEVGDLLTLLSLTPHATGVTSQGLAYPLKNAAVPFGTSLGISNVFTNQQVTITAEKGSLLAIHTPLKE